jgi:hypothetical protein
MLGTSWTASERDWRFREVHLPESARGVSQASGMARAAHPPRSAQPAKPLYPETASKRWKTSGLLLDRTGGQAVR